MEEINNIEVTPCTESDYLKPLRVHYNQNGTKKSWDFMRTHDSVSVLIFNTSSHCFVLVKQFRPGIITFSVFSPLAVFMCEWERNKTQPPQSAEKPEEGASEAAAPAAEPQEGQSAAEGRAPPPPGVTYELCAGLVDKPNLSLEEIARQEVLEETPMRVFMTEAPGVVKFCSNSRQRVSDDNCVSAGGGEPGEGELIEVVKVPLHEAMTFAYDERIPKTMGVIFSFIWFHNNMSPKYKISTMCN
ncbi:hypothetical protein F7725_019851 [Dissostichus mawsoni]|uniref:Uridine diphosphate glucose pyrophosphatase NUDT14 n=1 Tax=Dissostichus mawsoni TaxID=36200 RepID=A0A7J5YKW9_DISMA|nr:hypothetical protein F7725_019851 [Dissostichus mawsoni]